MNRYVLNVSVLLEGKTTYRARAEASQDGQTIAVGDRKAQSVARAVGESLELVWDKLVPVAVVDARDALAGRRKLASVEVEVVEEGPVGVLPDEVSSLFPGDQA
jgi:hypothetical protein